MKLTECSSFFDPTLWERVRKDFVLVCFLDPLVVFGCLRFLGQVFESLERKNV